jgi:hypothetical protein
MGIDETKRMPLACLETLCLRREAKLARKKSQDNPRRANQVAYDPRFWTDKDRQRWGAVKWGLDKHLNPDG